MELEVPPGGRPVFCVKIETNTGPGDRTRLGELSTYMAPEGTKASGTDEEIYLGKLYSYFRRGWQVPALISQEELQKLTCVIELSITEDGRVGGYELKRSSGNEAFDESVRRRMNQAEGAELPPPPESVVDRILGETISLRFFGSHVR